MPDSTVVTGDGDEYTYYQVFRHGGHDDQHDQHHQQMHGAGFNPDPTPDLPITSHRIIHKSDTVEGGQQLSARAGAEVDHDEKAMVVLQGRLESDEYFIRCINQDHLAGDPF